MDDQTQLSFQDTTWLRSFPLIRESALDYFALSPFYDRSSNNEQCRMQGLDPTAAMKNMTGIEYVLANLPPEGPAPRAGASPLRHLFVIKKQLRRSRINAEVHHCVICLQCYHLWSRSCMFSTATAALVDQASLECYKPRASMCLMRDLHLHRAWVLHWRRCRASITSWMALSTSPLQR
jgi:MED6 mediator sub complex component